MRLFLTACLGWILMGAANAAPVLVPPVQAPADSSAWHLGRAVDLWDKGDLRGAVVHLESVDSDRGAFLLATAQVILGDRDGLARTVASAGDAEGSVWRRWVAYLGLVDGVADAPVSGFARAHVLAAARLLAADDPQRALELLDDPHGDPLALSLAAVAAGAAGRDATPYLEDLSTAPADSDAAADLVGAAVLERAAMILEEGRDPRTLLAAMPQRSVHRARGLHLTALVALAAGDTATGEGLLETVTRESPDYAERRAVLLERGALAAARQDWPTALERYEDAEQDHAAARAHFVDLKTEAGAAAAWRDWDAAGPSGPSETRLDSRAAHAAAATAARRALDLKRDAEPRPADTLDVAAGHRRKDGIPGPTPSEWAGLRSLRGELAGTEAALADQSWQLDRLADDRGRRAAYLTEGQVRAQASADTLSAAVRRLDLLLARLDLAVAELDSTRDHALARFAHRGRGLVAELQRNLLYMAALQHFHGRAPTLARNHPAGVPTPADLLDLETALAGEMEIFLERFAARSTTLIQDSYATIWRPRLLGDAPRLHAALGAELRRTELDLALLDSTAAVLDQDPAWLQARDRYAVLEAGRDSLVARMAAEQRNIAAAVADRGLAALAAEGEALALHAADAAYWLAVVAATDGNPDPATDGPPRAAAMGRHLAFLTDHPTSSARSEVRLRLADLHLLQARQEFEARMAGFLGGNPNADALQDRALAPFMDTAPALELYGAILADDPGYSHRAAVLFSLGMILADEGGADAEQHLQELVSHHAGSPYAQEAWLRLGDLGFARRDLSACREHYARAAAGPDPDLRGIALYKLGWARFEQDLFADAADAFGDLLDHDLARSAVDPAAQDLEDEARRYLVRSLLRGGGAPAFTEHFARRGDQPYGADILRSMGRLSRRFSLHDEAIACDTLWLQRYGHQAGAVDMAARLVDTHRLAERPTAARAALQDEAPRFLPGSSWHEANTDPAVREQGLVFAQDAYRTLATHHHQAARRDSTRADWQAALEHYGAWLEHWSGHADAPRMHYQAGEAAFSLDEHAASLDHFGQAAAADSGSFRTDAAWQTVVVTDAWYEAAGRPDSLGVRLLTAGDAFRAGHPDDPHLADLGWRQGHVAASHDDHDRAADVFARFDREHPDDPRAVDAARLAADGWYRLDDYERAGDAYAHASARAGAAGRDSLSRGMAAAVPVCRYRHAEAVADDPERGPAAAAPFFLALVDAWPHYPDADLALYRAGLGLDGSPAVAAWERLLAEHPASEYGRDAALEIARVHEAAGHDLDAALAYRRFSHIYRDDPEAADALLTAISLAADDPSEVRRLEDDFLTRFPGDVDQAMAIRQERADGAVQQLVSGSATLGALLAGGSDLQQYLDAAAVHPDLADPRILAAVDFRRAEGADAAYIALPLTQPLPVSLEAKQAQLEQVVILYNASAVHGVKEYTHAAAHRIGAAIVHFGDALTASERPAGLQGDDLAAYEEVLEEQGWDFHARGEAAWTELLRQADAADEDPGRWLDRTRELLWPRVALQFLHRPEVEYPLLAAAPPAEGR